MEIHFSCNKKPRIATTTSHYELHTETYVVMVCMRCYLIWTQKNRESYATQLTEIFVV